MFSMFAQKIDDGYGGFTYQPTMLSYTLLVLLILGILLATSSFHSKLHNENKNRRINVLQLAFSSIAIALALITSMISLFSLPMGGSVTLLSALFITLIGSWFGLSSGIFCGIAFGLLSMIMKPYIISIPQLLCDYVLAFGALGFSGLFHQEGRTTNIKAVILGYLTGVFGRFIFAVLSGVIFFASYAPAEGPFSNPLLYSVAYNASYIAAEAILTIIVLLLPPVKNAIESVSTITNR